MQRTHFGRRRRENSRAQARLASASGTSPTCPHATGLDQELLASTACGGLIIRRSWVRAPPAPPSDLGKRAGFRCAADQASWAEQEQNIRAPPVHDPALLTSAAACPAAASPAAICMWV